MSEENECKPIQKSDFEVIRKKCLEKGELFEDPDFPTKNESIFKNRKVPSNVEWLRPKEILKKFGLEKGPIFVKDGGSRMDIKQGTIGDCWVLAGAAAVCDIKEAFEWLVPQDQSFEPDWYAGIFRFRIWQYDTWVEVYVDDRLPVFKKRYMMASSTDKNIFWGCLLEKAYAKLHGSYEAIESGTNAESLIDFTGGIAEFYYLHEVNNLRRLLKKAFNRTTIVASSIFGDDSDGPSKNGLVSGHAYSVTGFGEAIKKHITEKSQFLVRIRNPWGTEDEWNGTWSDSSLEWDKLTEESIKLLEVVKKDDGEFWMSITDYKWEFDGITLCHFALEDITDGCTKNWEIAIHHGSWVAGETATGAPETKEAFEKCKQYYIKLNDYDDDDVASVIVQLTQKGRRQLGKEATDIGYAICKIPEGSKPPITFEDALELNQEEIAGFHADSGRDVTKRFDLDPGEYVIVAFTKDEGIESDYMLRIFSEAPFESNEI